ncbi:MAG: hypothetical protein OQJ89_12315, partial [Kangiellaceae bacterium]|nr:hypothetical protein [Kangiellaceae bacterium]
MTKKDSEVEVGSRKSERISSSEEKVIISEDSGNVFARINQILLWSSDNPHRWPRYLGLALACLGLIWGSFITYIKVASPKYKSEWTLILPGKGMGANVSLVDIGQTSTAAASPYASASTNPKSNYKEFATSL